MCDVLCAPAEGPGRPRRASPRVSGFTGSWQPRGAPPAALLEERARLPRRSGNASAGAAAGSRPGLPAVSNPATLQGDTRTARDSTQSFAAPSPFSCVPVMQL